MPTADNIKQERMHIRLDAHAKLKLERAAAYTHKSLSDFVLGEALSSADDVISDNESISLEQSDWGVFLDALENPSAPNAKIKLAFAKHNQRVKR